ncbi:MAG: prolyl oligopeptidase family serine peptidase [Oscillospiraceae bacterium]|nr:prolyl oligopeptidase family serine peptidase [Oscillospiraceae bacterium]
MEKLITFENLNQFAYVNHEICQRPIQGIILYFPGLNNTNMYPFDTDAGAVFGEHGLLYVIPYNNPWAWMNRQAVAYTDEIVDVLIDALELDDHIPVVSTGRSMGGYGALLYTLRSKRTPVSCIANSPVCDAVYHYTERNDLPRTMYSALFHEPGTLDEALRAMSPLHQVEQMPRVPYHLFHCTGDTSVDLHRHTEPFVAAMRETGHEITCDILPGRKHCDLTYAAKRRYVQYVLQDIRRAR